MTERDANNRKIAKLLGWTLVNYETGDPATTPEHFADASNNDGWSWEGSPDNKEAWQWNFYTSESANAMLLDAMPHAHLIHEDNGVWWCTHEKNWPGVGGRGDRKTAICEAFMKWKEKP